MDVEHWMPVVGYEDRYEVSNLGRIRSLERYSTHRNGRRNFLKQRFLNPWVRRDGYLGVDLYENGKSKSFLAHRLILIAFIGMRVGKKECNHINGLKTDNRLENLEWVTRSENNLHSCRVLGHRLGEKNWCAKLNEKQVIRIRREYSNGGVTHLDLARKYRVSKSSIRAVVNRKTWRHIPKVLHLGGAADQGGE